MISGPVRLGVVGLGRIARAYIDAIPALPAEHAALTAVATRKSKPPVELSEDVNVHSRYEDLLNDPSVDAVIICYPNAKHRDAVVAAADAGKHTSWPASSLQESRGQGLRTRRQSAPSLSWP